MGRKRKILIWVLACLAFVIVVRALLPIGVKRYVNKTLAGLDGYRGSVEDVDLALWRGAYRAEGLLIDKEVGGAVQPFARIQGLDISIEWRSLFKGELVTEVVVESPKLNMTAADGGDEEEDGELGTGGNWVDTLRELVPFRLNRLEVKDGELRFRGGKDAVLPELVVQPFSVLATNISNVDEETDELPSALEAIGRLEDGSTINWSGKFDLFRDSIDMDMELSCESIDLPRFNELLQRYAAIDAKEGTLGVYSEWAVADGQIDGYLKFVATDFEVFDLKQDGGNPLSAIWEAVAGFAVWVTKNKPKDQFASKIPFQGQVEQMKMGTLPAIISLLKNGFVKALTNKVDQTITIGSVEEES